MEVEKINAQTAVIHLAAEVVDDDAPKLKQLLQSLYEEGMQLIRVDFNVTALLRQHCLAQLILYHKKLKDRGG